MTEKQKEYFQKILGCYVFKPRAKSNYSYHEELELSEKEIEHIKSLDGNEMIELIYNDTFNWGESYSVCFIAIGSEPVEEQLIKFIEENDLEQKLQEFNKLKPSDFKDVYDYFRKCQEKIKPLMQALYKRHPLDWYDYLDEETR